MKTLMGDDGDEPPRLGSSGGNDKPPRPNDAVRIIRGPFADFLGIVDKVNQEKGKVRVRVSMFGRETLAELDFSEVEPFT
jgi:transcription antitermination factor NusG